MVSGPDGAKKRIVPPGSTRSKACSMAYKCRQLIDCRAYYTGVEVQSFGSALIAAVVIGLINASIGLFLKIITIPLSILTFGIFLLVINALMLMFASSLLSGFTVPGFWAAFFGAVVLAIVNMVIRSLIASK